MSTTRSLLELEVVDLTVHSGTESEEETVFSARSLLPSSQQSSQRSITRTPGLKKELSLFHGVTMIVGSIIGSGIFFTPQIVLAHTGSFGLCMVAWVLGGFIALAGALCFVELSLLVRSSGGDYSFLLKGYSFNRRNKATVVVGDCLAFMYIWCSVFILRPGGIAILSLTCAHYLAQPFFIHCSAPDNAVKLLALAVTRTLSITH